MAKPLKSEVTGRPKDMQFAHFGVLDAGAQSKTSTVTAITVNVLLAFVIVVIGAATKKTMDNNKKLTELTMPVTQPKVEPIKPKIIPPKPPPLPEVPKIVTEAPKIVVPEKLPEPPKPIVMNHPPPIIPPVAPLKITPPAAPVAVNLSHPAPASVVNNSPKPEAVRLGNQTSPVPNLTGPAVSSVNLARGMPGMNSQNTGAGPAATSVHLGNGSPNSTATTGNGVQAVRGLTSGAAGGTGTAPGVASSVRLGAAPPPPAQKAATAATAAQHPSPRVIYKPKPEYTAEAIQMHLEGTVSIHIHVLPDGSVQVVGVTSGLGHGLDESAKRAILATKFEPATDASGHPIVWDGTVNITFQLAG